jgi:hypothetical protein
VTPTKTSQLQNDGSNGVPFAVVSQIPAPVDISGKLDGDAAYPAWREVTTYYEGDIVFHNGRLWRCIAGNLGDEPGVSQWWTNATVQTIIAANISTNALAGQTYDFSRNYDIIRATADIVQLLGGTVTNNPTEQGGN